jgi:prolyl oligopeptidase
MKKTLIWLALAGTAATAAADVPDPYIWLEDVGSVRSLDWVAQHNAASTALITRDPAFETTRGQIRAILDSSERIAYVTRMGEYYYNFWRDGDHPRGLWRRTRLAQYRSANPAWETVLDLDALARTENENWVWKGQECRYPDWDRCLISLSRGGADAVVVREFDLPARAFVSDGFQLPEAKSDVHWLDRDALFVGTDFGPGSLTDSGYPREVRLWRRGTPLASAAAVFAGAQSDVAVGAYVSQSPAYRREIVLRSPSFFTGEYWLRQAGHLSRIGVPDDAQLDFFGPQLLVQLRSDWQPGGKNGANGANGTNGINFKAGSLLAIDFDAFQAGKRNFQVLFEPSLRTALDSFATTRTHVVLSILDQVKGRLAEWRFDAGAWQRRDVVAPEFGSLGISALDHGETDDYFLTHVDYLTPDSLYLAKAGTDARERLKQRPAFFDARGLVIDQLEAVSRDGTHVPYFIVKPRDLVLDGSHPTLLYGYGGFEVALTPSYPAAAGKAWLEKGGVYVVANIRGGGEFGPRWHAAALKEKRQNAFDDFIAVAQDLVTRKITRPARLGIMGGSNGGLLMGVMFTQRPELFGAVVCQVPLLDMRRYNRLLAGASWMGEYGDPDDAQQWAYIARYSPYQNVHGATAYPKILFTTSTRDDRVHPGHARKMMARMEELGVKSVWYYENTEGGHAGAADNSQAAFMNALEYTFLWEMLGGK